MCAKQLGTYSSFSHCLRQRAKEKARERLRQRAKEREPRRERERATETESQGERQIPTHRVRDKASGRKTETKCLAGYLIKKEGWREMDLSKVTVLKS